MKKNKRQKSVHFFKNLSRQIVVIFKLYTIWHNFNKIPPIYLVNTLLILNKNQKQFLQRKKIIECLEQIDSSQENLTQPLVVTVETFRRSDVEGRGVGGSNNIKLEY